MLGSRTRSRLLSLTVPVAVLLAFGLAGPSPAATVSGPTWVATPDGLVGVQQAVAVRAPGAVGQVTTIAFSNDSAGSNAGQAIINQQGFAYLPWTPNLPGTWTVAASVGGVDLGSSTISVDAMPTTTSLLAPGAVQAGRTSTLTARVQALGGQITPSGTVTVRNNSDNVVAQGALRPSSDSGLAVASLAWTPVAGSTSLVAEYTPATSAFTASTSRAQTPTVGPQPALTLQLPPVSYVGVEDTYEVLIASDRLSSQGGSAAFSVGMDGFTFYGMGGSMPVSDGVSSTTWIPAVPGVQTIQVSYSSADSRFSGTTAQPINVQPAPKPDTITTDSDGFSSGASLAVGTSVDPLLTAASGNPVVVATEGPCVVNAGSLSLLGVGTCRVQARSLGNGGSLTAASENFTLEVIRAAG